MRLIKKLQKEQIYINLHNFKLTKESAKRFEKIADDYAIEFADWVNVNAYKYPTKITTKELLEIFKKEKGL